MQKDFNEPFELTKEIYERDFLPVYNFNHGAGNLKTLIQFKITLPFYIPLGVGKTITISADDEISSFIFDKVVTNDSYKYSLIPDTPVLDIHHTKVIIMTAVMLNYETLVTDTENYIDHYFDKALVKLNRIVDAYMSHSQDIDCHYITNEMLQPFIVVEYINLNLWTNTQIVYQLHEHIPYEKELLSEDDMYNFSRLQTIAAFNLNPFINIERHAFFAERYLKQGFYHEAVIYAQISVEVFIEQVYKEILKESEDKTDEEAHLIIENTAFITIVKSKLKDRLGGSWDTTNDTGVVGKWYKTTYELRNKAIHSGKTPTFWESKIAVHNAVEFRKFILERIKTNKKKYPGLNKYLFKIKSSL